MPSTVKSFALESARVLWRLVFYFAVLIGAFWLLSQGYSWAIKTLGIQFAHGPDTKPAEAVGLGQARLLIAALVAWALTARFGRDRLDPILPLHSRGFRHVLEGTLWGFAGIAATMGAIAAFGGYQVSGVALSGTGLLYYLPLWLIVALINGVAENLAVMGYPMIRTARSTGWIPAIILVSILFAAAHGANPGESPMGLFSVFLIGALMATTVRFTGDLWLSAGIHAGIIIGEDLVFSVPDSGTMYTGHLLVSRLTGPAWLSGGEAGPEGSLFALLIFALLLVLLWVVYGWRPNGSGSGESGGAEGAVAAAPSA